MGFLMQSGMSKGAIKKEIETLENEISIGKKGNRKNLIILTGNRLQLGISLRSVDIVAMWNTIQSIDAIFQMLFRSMTEVIEPEYQAQYQESMTEPVQRDRARRAWIGSDGRRWSRR